MKCIVWIVISNHTISFFITRGSVFFFIQAAEELLRRTTSFASLSTLTNNETGASRSRRPSPVPIGQESRFVSAANLMAIQVILKKVVWYFEEGDVVL